MKFDAYGRSPNDRGFDPLAGGKKTMADKHDPYLHMRNDKGSKPAGDPTTRSMESKAQPAAGDETDDVSDSDSQFVSYSERPPMIDDGLWLAASQVIAVLGPISEEERKRVMRTVDAFLGSPKVMRDGGQCRG